MEDLHIIMPVSGERYGQRLNYLSGLAVKGHVLEMHSHILVRGNVRISHCHYFWQEPVT